MKKYILSSLFFGICIGVLAQQDSAWTMTLERDFAPIVHQTDKIDRTPEIEQPVVNRTAVEYSRWEAQPSSRSETGNLPFGQVVVERPQDTIGWVEAHIGYPLAGALEAYARHSGWSVNLGGQAVWHDRKLNHDDWKKAGNDYDWKSKYVDGHLRIGYDHSFGDTFNEKARIRAHAGAEGMIFKGFNWSADFSRQTAPAWKQADSLQSKTQVYTVFAGTEFDYGQWAFDLNYSYTRLQGPSGTEIIRLLRQNYDFDDVSHFINGSIRWYGTDFGKLRFAASLPFGVAFGNWDGFLLKPTIRLSYLPDQNKWRRFFVDAGAGWSHTSMRRYLHASPFLTQGEFQDKEFDIIDAVAGWEDYEQGYLKYKIWVSAKWAVNTVGGYMSADLPKSLGLRTVVEGDDNLALRAGVDMQYEYNRYFRVNFDARWVHHSSNRMIPEPSYNVGLHLLSSPSDRLDLDLGFEGGWDRKGLLLDGSRNEYKIDMGDIRNLMFRADCRIFSSLSVFLWGDNLLNRNFDRWALVPARRLTVSVGAKWSF